MPLVKMPTGETVNMPDNPTADQLAELQRITGGLNTAPPGGSSAAPTTTGSTSTGSSAEQPSLGEQFMRQLGLNSRYMMTGLGSTVGMVGDPLNAVINKVAGTHLGTVSQASQELADKMGLPRPETPVEKVVGAIATMGYGLADPLAGAISSAVKGAKALGGGEAALYDAPTQLTERGARVKAAQDAGLVVPPKEAGTSPVGEMLQNIFGSGKVNQIAASKNQKVFQKLASQEAGVKTGQLTPDNLKNAIAATEEEGYGPVKNLGIMPTDNLYSGALADIAYKQGGMRNSFPGAQRQDILDLVKGYDTRKFTGADAVKAIQELRRQAGSAYRSGDNDMGEAANSIAKAIENNIEMHMTSGTGPSTGNVDSAATMDAFRGARAQMAKQYAVQRAMDDAGNINPAKLSGPLTGNLAVMRDFAAQAPLASKVPKEDPGLLSQSDLISGLITGALFHHPIGAAIPLLRAGGQRALLTKPAQGLFASPEVASQAAGELPSWARMLPAGSALATGLYGQ